MSLPPDAAPVVSYTHHDMLNAMMYARQRMRLHWYKHLTQTHPQLATHMRVVVERANPDAHYFYTDKFHKRAVVTSIAISEHACANVACNSTHMKGACTPTDTAGYIRVGDANEFRLNCQPACFNMHTKKRHRDIADKPVYDMPNWIWNNDRGKCYMVNAQMEAYMLAPIVRSQDRYQIRVNDLPVGYNSGERDPLTNTGRTYIPNPTYCAAYMDNYVPADQKCEPSTALKVFGYLLGEHLLKTIGASASMMLHATFDVPTYPQAEPAVPPRLPANMTVDGWKNDIDHTAPPPPDVGMDVPDDVPMAQIDERQERLRANAILVSGKPPKTSDERRQEANTAAASDDDNASAAADDARSEIDAVLNSFAGQQWEKMFRRVSKVMSGMLEGLESQEGINMVLVNDLAHSALSGSKRLFTFMAREVVPILVRTLEEESQILMTGVLRSAASAALMNTLVSSAARVAGRVLVALSEALVSATTVVGLVLAVSMVFDLIFSLWDPMNFNSEFDGKTLRNLVAHGEQQLRQKMQTNELSLSFDVLINMVVDHDELQKGAMMSMIYAYEYLDHLTVNSDGSVIDKGSPMAVHPPTQQDQDAMASMHYTYTDSRVTRYRDDMRRRMEGTRLPHYLLVVGGTVGTLFMVLRRFILAVFLLVVAVAASFLLYVQMDSDTPWTW